MDFPTLRRRGGVQRTTRHEEGVGGASDARHPDARRGYGRVRPGSAPTPLDSGEDFDEPVSGLNSVGAGGYSGPALAVTGYTPTGVQAPGDFEEKFLGGTYMDATRRQAKGGDLGPYPVDDPVAIKKIFGIDV